MKNSFDSGFRGGFNAGFGNGFGNSSFENAKFDNAFKSELQKQNLNALNALQKRSAKRFGEDMKGLNEFIGVLQIAQMSLRKILKALDSEDANSEIQNILENTQFMGVAIFGTTFSAQIAGLEREFLVDNPLALMPDIDALKLFVNEKISESGELLLQLSDALTTPAQSSFESVDINKLASMLKG